MTEKARRILLLHITAKSGHHRASIAIANSIRSLDPAAQVLNVDAVEYTNPAVRWAIRCLYFQLIRHQPDVWEYLYDNPDVHRHVQGLRALLHRYHAAKLKRLLEEFRPDAILCTQAYPCGMVADYKRHYGLSVPVVGVLTDYAPHLYWFHDTVDLYVVPSEEVSRRFFERGVEASRVRPLGIPIDPVFAESSDVAGAARRYGLDPFRPVLLIMGGGSGFGQLREIVQRLDTLPLACQMVIVAGTNDSLLRWARNRRFRHRVVALGFTEDIADLMALATILVSKPGGLTTSEALAKGLPMVMVNPISGQEAYNARFLLGQGAALAAGSPVTVRQTVRDLLESPRRLLALRERALELARPNAAEEVGRLALRLCDAAKESGRAMLEGAAAV